MVYKTNTPEVVKETVMEEFDSADRIIKRTIIKEYLQKRSLNDYISYDTYNTHTISNDTYNTHTISNDTYNTHTISNTDTFKNKSPIVNSSNGTAQISKANIIHAYGYSDSAKDTISNLNTED